MIHWPDEVYMFSLSLPLSLSPSPSLLSLPPLSLSGDITQQGFEKKKAKLLAPYLTITGNDTEPLLYLMLMNTVDGTGSIGSNSSGRSSSPQPPSYVEHDPQHHVESRELSYYYFIRR